MIEPIYVYSITITIIAIVFLYYLLKGVVTDEEKSHILLQKYGSYGKTKEIKKLPFHSINIIRRVRIVSQFSGTPKKEITYILEVNPMSHTNVEFKVK